MTFINNLQGYRYVYSQAAKKDLKKLDKQIVKKIDNKLKALVAGNQGLDIKKLIGLNHPRYRMRVANYRVLYEIHESEIIVIVIGIGHRKDIYKK